MTDIQILKLISESREHAKTDLRAANEVIDLYAQLTLNAAAKISKTNDLILRIDNAIGGYIPTDISIAAIKGQDPEKLLIQAVDLTRKIQDDINTYAKNSSHQ